MKKYLAVKFLLFVFLTGLLVVSVPGYSAAQKVITLNYANYIPAPHPQSVIAEQWGNEIEKRTNGRVKFTYFHGNTLTQAAQTYDSTIKGICDIGLSNYAYTRGKFPLMEVIDLPLGIQDGTTATGLVTEFVKKFKPKELDDVKVLYTHAHGPGLLFTVKRPVYKLEDVKGLKVRSTGLAAKVVQALGGTPVGTSMAETYDALRTGVADATMAPYMAVESFRWGEIVKYATHDYGASSSSSFFVVMNKGRWNSLPPDIQKIFTEVSEEYAKKTGALWDATDKAAIESTAKRGLKQILLSPKEDARWAAAVKPLLNEYVQDMKGKGLPGEEALKFCQDYIKAHTKDVKATKAAAPKKKK